MTFLPILRHIHLGVNNLWKNVEQSFLPLPAIWINSGKYLSLYPLLLCNLGEDWVSLGYLAQYALIYTQRVQYWVLTGLVILINIYGNEEGNNLYGRWVKKKQDKFGKSNVHFYHLIKIGNIYKG